MAIKENHSIKNLSSASVGNVMWALYQFVQETDTAHSIALAADAGTSTVGLYTDNGSGTKAFGLTPTSAANFTDGTYMVIQPVYYYGDGTTSTNGRWNCVIGIVGTDIKYNLIPAGGWVQTATNAGTGLECTGLQIVTAAANATQVYCSASNVETYDSGTKRYSYFRFALNGAGTPGDGLYVGGYVPLSPASDTKPICALAGGVYSTTGTANTWSANGSPNGTRCRAPSDYAHSSGSISTTPACFAWINGSAQVGNGFGTDRAGQNVAPSIYLLANGGVCLGTFGPNTFLGFDATALSNFSMDASGSYVKVNDLLHRFKL